jgi:ferredoxin
MINYQITLKDTDITYDCSDKQTVLHGMEKLGIKGIPVGCRGGGCGVCKVYILDGTYTAKKMSRAHISEEEQTNGYVLACRCNPDSNLTIKVVGEMKSSFSTN